ncbi:hypothetical protein BHE74_00052346 [Ensete ventricosum]|nr:hypothetical protein BHE74_00052346 [Ensete ventricosum]
MITVSQKNSIVKYFARIARTVECRSVFPTPTQKFKILAIPDVLPMGSRTSLVSRKNTTVINFARSRAQSRVSIDFSCIVSEIQNTGHSRRITHGKSYEHGFAKKCHVSISFSCTISEIQNIGHSRCIMGSHAQSRVSIGFSCIVLKIQNTGHSRRIRP